MFCRALFLLALSGLQSFILGCGASPDVRSGLAPVRFGRHVLWVEIAATETTRSLGLMARDLIPEDEGMLFVFPIEQELPFRMHNTLMDLDIAFVNRAGIIVDIQELKALDETIIYSRNPAKYAIEANRGWFKSKNIRVGDGVQLPAEVTECVPKS